LDFNSGSPVAVTNGKLASIEGSAVMSDVNGNLLFYTNSENIWNRNHEVMLNGADLDGNTSSVQSAVIVPLPGSSVKYYIFTNGSYINSGFKYSIVDTQLEGGLGAVEFNRKNVELSSKGSESLAATKHCNNEDYWIVTRIIGDHLSFNAYLLCASGISHTVSSSFDIPINPIDNVSHLKFFTDGSKLVSSSFGTDTYIFNFNKSTGKLTIGDKILTLSSLKEATYASALSSDNTKLYLSSWEIKDLKPKYCNLVQYDLSAADLTASRIVLDKVDFSFGSPNGYGFRGNLQLGPDVKIYI
jgi:hypothetical protein